LNYNILWFKSTMFPYYPLEGPSWSWSYGSLIYYYLWYQCLSPLTLGVRIPVRRGVLDTTLCDEVCQWFSSVTPVSSTNKTYLHAPRFNWNILKVALNTINQHQAYCPPL